MIRVQPYKFLSTPSARRATRASPKRRLPGSHFYPRPPRGGRPLVISDVSQVLDFYPRPPRGGRHGRAGGVLLLDLFLSTPSARRATSKGASAPRAIFYFYPRPPRGGRPARPVGGILPRNISIHALREEGDSFTTRRSAWSTNFYPRPPRGGRPGPLR